MKKSPNILFLMVDQLQSGVMHPDHPCKTPNLDKLAARGVRFTRAITPNAICSPARASLMTGLLPHRHGVYWVTQNHPPDEGKLRTQFPHWAQRLQSAGYHTSYFGKWHVEDTDRLSDFGWEVDRGLKSPERTDHIARLGIDNNASESFKMEFEHDRPHGYKTSRLCGVSHLPIEKRRMGLTTATAADHLNGLLAGNDDRPWCAFVSLTEPHDPFVCSEKAHAMYEGVDIPLPPSLRDDLTNRPGLYKRAQSLFNGMSDENHREAARCYAASVTEIDTLFGRLLDMLDEFGVKDETIVVFTTDHGEHLGAHGLYCKNIKASEEVYNIPLIMAGPGIAQGETCNGRVMLHDLCPTLLELTGAEPIGDIDSRSFSELLTDPGADEDWQVAYAEYFGGRYWFTQKVYYEDNWKLVFNGFDFDEMYNLGEDPHEMENLAHRPEYKERHESLMRGVWKKIKETGDDSLIDSHYRILNLGVIGPDG